jgi:hypothetical protein
MAARWDFKLCCVATRLLFDLICGLEMEQIYQETVSYTIPHLIIANPVLAILKRQK